MGTCTAINIAIEEMSVAPVRQHVVTLHLIRSIVSNINSRRNTKLEQHLNHVILDVFRSVPVIDRSGPQCYSVIDLLVKPGVGRKE